MTKKISEIDKLIEEALAEEESEFYKELKEMEDPSLLEETFELFRGKYKWINIYASVMQVLIFSFSIYCLVRFFQVEELRQMIIWSVLFFFSMAASVQIKIIQWQMINRNSIIREIKRLELQVGLLSRELGKHKSKGE